VRAEEINESLTADIQEELGHSQLLGQRLEQLGARPPSSIEPPLALLAPPAPVVG
jgi:bacterioferritin